MRYLILSLLTELTDFKMTIQAEFCFAAFIKNTVSLSNISKTSASVSSGVSNTEKHMKARGCRPSAFIVSRCLEPLMKHEARVFDITSPAK